MGFVRDKSDIFADKMHWKREHQPYTEGEWNGIHSLKPKRRSRRGAPVMIGNLRLFKQGFMKNIMPSGAPRPMLLSSSQTINT